MCCPVCQKLGAGRGGPGLSSPQSGATGESVKSGSSLTISVDSTAPPCENVPIQPVQEEGNGDRHAAERGRAQAEGCEGVPGRPSRWGAGLAQRRFDLPRRGPRAQRVAGSVPEAEPQPARRLGRAHLQRPRGRRRGWGRRPGALGHRRRPHASAGAHQERRRLAQVPARSRRQGLGCRGTVRSRLRVRGRGGSGPARLPRARARGEGPAGRAGGSFGRPARRLQPRPRPRSGQGGLAGGTAPGQAPR